MTRSIIAAFALLLAVPTLAQDPPGVGCLSNHPRTCFAPAVGVSLLRVPFADPKATSTFSPNLGYGVTFQKGRWYETGLAFGLGLRDTDGAPLEPAIIASFANYFRIGLAGTIGGDQTFVKSMGIVFSLGYSL